MRAILLLTLLAGCTTTTVVYRNEQNPTASLAADVKYCRDGRTDSRYIACLKDKGWATETWELP